jgi:hypothetical protein
MLLIILFLLIWSLLCGIGALIKFCLNRYHRSVSWDLVIVIAFAMTLPLSGIAWFAIMGMMWSAG